MSDAWPIGEFFEMSTTSSRRDFLAAGIALPAVAAAPASAAASEVRYGVLGKTGLKVSRLGFGCMLVSDPTVVERALDMGINFFDTARSYQGGNNERMVGAVIKSKRKNLILETKTQARNKEDALKDLDKSLQELGTDYVDIWYLHSRNTMADLSDDVFEAQQIAKKQGKIRFAGVSTHFLKDLIDPLVKRGQTDVILTTYSFSLGPENRIEESIRKARDAGMGVVAMKVMAGGFARIRRGDRLLGADAQSVTKRLQQPGAMVSALKWAFRNPRVDTAIVGITDSDQLDENFAAMSAPFTDADSKQLSAQLDYIRPLYCRMCGSCAGQCPQGVPVADMLRILSYADGYGQFPLARERFLELPESARQVRCSDCSHCAVQCPNGVQVARRLRRAQELLA